MAEMSNTIAQSNSSSHAPRRGRKVSQGSISFSHDLSAEDAFCLDLDRRALDAAPAEADPYGLAHDTWQHQLHSQLASPPSSERDAGEPWLKAWINDFGDQKPASHLPSPSPASERADDESLQHAEADRRRGSPAGPARSAQTDDSSSSSRRSGSSGSERGAGQRFAPPAVQPALILFRNFSVEEMLGEGRYGTVWRCTHRVTGQPFACKQLEKDHSAAHALERELACLAAAQGHPHVLHLEGVFESDRFVYLLTEFCSAGDLFDLISRQTHMPEAQARDLLLQLAQALQHCHARGVMHRDIKPENVLLHRCSATGRLLVKLADFGLSTLLEPGEMATGWVGSKPYDAPEVSGKMAYSFPADIFSLGVVLFAMLSGNWPSFVDGPQFQPDHDFVFPVWRGVSIEAKTLVTRMLALYPEMRPSAGSLLEDPWVVEDCMEEAQGGGQGMGCSEELLASLQSLLEPY